jgi:hypothetical protein
MKSKKFSAVLMLAIAFTFSCSDSNGGGSGSNPIKKDKISGVSQKGPFVKGSTATLYELDGNFNQTGRSFRDIIADDHGKFEIKGVELISPYAMLEADGFYRNEVTGQISVAPIKLYAIADIREKDNVNVNILTHWEYYRVLNLVENSGKTVAEAKKQAQKEILAVFGISGEFENSEDMSIFGTSEGDAALLAISVLLQGDLGEGEFSQRLTDFAQSIKENGTWDNENRSKLVNGFSYGYINNAILSWELSSEIPDYEKYVKNYIISFLGECTEEKWGLNKKLHNGTIIGCYNVLERSGQWIYEWTKPNFYPENDCTETNEGRFENIPVPGEYNAYVRFKCIDGDWWNRVD